MKEISGGVTAAKGFRAGGISSGLKPNQIPDLAMIVSEVPAAAACVTTQNAVKAAPVLWDNQIVRDGNQICAVIANSGNANACTGQRGIEDVKSEAEAVSKKIGCKPEQVFVSSTGVIGVPLDIEKIMHSVPLLADSLSADLAGADRASRAIMTTDTVPKTAACELNISGKTVHIGAMAKGSGMICPNMATMLSFVTTDCNIDRDCLQEMLSDIVTSTYNMMSVDGDMSTNDTVVILANGLAGNSLIDKNSENYQTFKDALYYINETIAKNIVRDGEGATKFLEAFVTEADTEEHAKILAKSVIQSNLVKAAFFGEDANWGRVLSSLGGSGIDFNPSTVTLYFANEAGRILLLKNGTPVDFDESQASKILSKNGIQIQIHMGMGDASAKAWGCDLTYDYVKINGEYRT